VSAIDIKSIVSSYVPMTVSSESESTRELIQVLIKIHEDMLKIPGLPNKQKDDIRQLRGRLDALILQTDEANIKLQLIDIMNRLN
jgi:F0F1-type ATP synthase alpha subunit